MGLFWEMFCILEKPISTSGFNIRSILSLGFLVLSGKKYGGLLLLIRGFKTTREFGRGRDRGQGRVRGHGGDNRAKRVFGKIRKREAVKPEILSWFFTVVIYNLLARPFFDYKFSFDDFTFFDQQPLIRTLFRFGIS